jgi:hypothetical protein
MMVYHKQKMPLDFWSSGIDLGANAPFFCSNW